MLDLAIVVAFVAYSVSAGFRARRQSSRDLTEYFLAGRTLRGWRAGVSMAATQYAADTPLLVTGLVATGGIFSLWRLWIYGIAFLLMGFVLGKPWRRAGVLTDAELTEIRYSGPGIIWLRVLKAVYYGTVINCVVMAFVLVAATRIFEIFLPWHLWLPDSLYRFIQGAVEATGFELSAHGSGLGAELVTTNSAISIAITLLFVTLYSTTGGLRSVVSTDIVQFALMMIGTFVYALLAVRAAGGRQEILQGLTEHYGPSRASQMLDFIPPAEEALIPFLVVVSLQWLFQMNSDGTGYLAQRTMACAADREARIAAAVFTLAQIVMRTLLWLPIVLALLVLYPIDVAGGVSERAIAEQELMFAQGIDRLLPAGVRGLMLTGMLAALASTLDTHLNWGASYWSNDLYKAVWVERVRRREAGSRELVLVARLSNVLVLAIAVAITANLGSIRTAWQISLLFGAGIGAVLLLRWLWERITLHCEAVAIVVSLVVSPILLYTVAQDWLRLLLMALISTAAVLVTALIGPATDRQRLVAFYRRVDPPGWWRETAIAAGADPRRSQRMLARELCCVAAAAVTVYGLLLGTGLLIVEPGSWLLALVTLAAAGAATPYWVRRL